MQKEKIFDIKKRSYLWCIQIIKTVKELPKHDIASPILARQLIRAASSVIANLVEAQAGSSKKDFTNFNNISLKSANETKLWIQMIIDTIEISQKTKKTLEQSLEEITEIANIVASIIIKSKKT